MKIFTKLTICAAVAVAMLTAVLTGCALRDEEGKPNESSVLPADAGETTTETEATTGSSTKPETTGRETDTETDAETAESETTETKTASEEMDPELWASLPEELREQIEKFGKGYDVGTLPEKESTNYFENWRYNEIVIWVYPYFNDKEYTVLDFKEIEDCTEIENARGPRTPDKPDRVLLLKLSSYSRGRALEVLRILMKRPDIYTAFPADRVTPQPDELPEDEE